jgi:hypothetical protein
MFGTSDSSTCMVGPSDNLTAVHFVIATNGPGQNPRVDKESRTKPQDG